MSAAGKEQTALALNCGSGLRFIGRHMVRVLASREDLQIAGISAKIAASACGEQ